MLERICPSKLPLFSALENEDEGFCGIKDSQPVQIYEKGIFKMSAFMLHQAAEHSLVGLIQAYTGYRAGTHSVDKLLRYSELFTTKITDLFPRNTPEETEIFKRLNSAYIETRYREDYVITDAEIAILSRRVNLLTKTVGDLYEQKSANVVQNNPQELIASLNR
jgi:HEPN domain-containing protein